MAIGENGGVRGVANPPPPQLSPGPLPTHPDTYHRDGKQQQLGRDSEVDRTGLAVPELPEPVNQQKQGAWPQSGLFKKQQKTQLCGGGES